MVNSQTIKPENVGGALSDALQRMAKLGVENADKVFRAAAIKTFTDIIVETPVDEGTARNNWQLSFGSPVSKILKGKNKTKGRSYVSGKMKKGVLTRAKSGKIKVRKVFLTNNLPYIEALEYGRFPEPVKNGTRVKGKGFEKRSSGGFSRQAPSGMVRKNTAKFSQTIKTLVKRF